MKTLLPKITLIALLALVIGFYSETDRTPNPGSRVLPALTLINQGTWAIDIVKDHSMDKSFVNGHYYTDKAPLSTILLLPLVKIGEWISPTQGFDAQFNRGLLLGGFFLASLPMALFAFEILTLTQSIFWALAFVLSTFLWVYSGTFFGHALAGLFVVYGYQNFCEKNRPVRAGIFLGLAFLTEFPTGLMIPILMATSLVCTRSLKPSLKLGFTFLPFFLAILAYNAAITGNPFSMVYSHVSNEEFSQMKTALGFQGPKLEAIAGLLFGSQRGFFIYAPIFAALFFRFRAQERTQLKFLVEPPALFFLGSLLVFSSYYMWNGGWAYGPRHLIPATMLIIYEISKHLKSEIGFRPWLYILAAVGFIEALEAKLTVKYMLPHQFSSPFAEVISPAFMAGKWNQDALTTRLFGVAPTYSFIVFLLLLLIATVASRRLLQK